MYYNLYNISQSYLTHIYYKKKIQKYRFFQYCCFLHSLNFIGLVDHTDQVKKNRWKNILRHVTTHFPSKGAFDSLQRTSYIENKILIKLLPFRGKKLLFGTDLRYELVSNICYDGLFLR